MREWKGSYGTCSSQSQCSTKCIHAAANDDCGSQSKPLQTEGTQNETEDIHQHIHHGERIHPEVGDPIIARDNVCYRTK